MSDEPEPPLDDIEEIGLQFFLKLRKLGGAAANLERASEELRSV